MKPIAFAGATIELKPPADWNEKEHGVCEPVWMKGYVANGLPTMETMWKPTAEELQQLIAGHAVRLTVLGRGHPPVWIDVRPFLLRGS